jgi:hypothetical protein
VQQDEGDKSMFDANTTITIGLRTSEGKRDVTVRWPTDEEWGAHRRRRKLMQRQLGRGVTESEIESGDADAKLYEAIKLNGAPPLSVEESGKIVDTIALCEVLDVRLGTDDAEVDMQTVMGPVTHTLRIPTTAAVKRMQRTVKYLNLPYNRTEIRANLEAPAALWDQCAGRAEGYAGAVPNLHKDVAVRELVKAIELEAAPKNDEGNF